MTERVSTYKGKHPVIIVAPHGWDDTNTDRIVESTIQYGDFSGVINRGFERADFVDEGNNKADCNRIDHAQEDVVYDEFLKPIEKCVERLYNKKNPFHPVYNPNAPAKIAYVIFVHGCGDQVHKNAGQKVQVVFGFGRAKTKKNNRLTCKTTTKSCLGTMMKKYATDGEIYEDSGGGRYSGWSSNNMNQFFRSHMYSQYVECIQLEFPYSTRKTKTRCDVTAMMLASAIIDMLDYTGKHPEVDFQTI